MEAPIIILPTVSVNLENYDYQVEPNFEQPKRENESVLTRSLDLQYVNDDKKGRLIVRIRVFDADANIKAIGKETIVGLKLFGVSDTEHSMIVSQYLPFEAKEAYGYRKQASILLKSEYLIDDPS